MELRGQVLGDQSGIRIVLKSSLEDLLIAKHAMFTQADSEDSDQSVRMHRLIRVFAGCTRYMIHSHTLRLLSTARQHGC